MTLSEQAPEDIPLLPPRHARSLAAIAAALTGEIVDLVGKIDDFDAAESSLRAEICGRIEEGLEEAYIIACEPTAGEHEEIIETKERDTGSQLVSWYEHRDTLRTGTWEEYEAWCRANVEKLRVLATEAQAGQELTYPWIR